MGRGSNLLYGHLQESSKPQFDYNWFNEYLFDDRSNKQRISDGWVKDSQNLFNKLDAADLLNSQAAQEFYQQVFEKIDLPINDHWDLAWNLSPLNHIKEDSSSSDLYCVEGFPDLFGNVMANLDINNSLAAQQAVTKLTKNLILLEKNKPLFQLWKYKIVKPGYALHVRSKNKNQLIHFLAKFNGSLASLLCRKNEQINWDNYNNCNVSSTNTDRKFCSRCVALVNEPQSLSLLKLKPESYLNFLTRCSNILTPEITQQVLTEFDQKQLLHKSVSQSLWQQVIEQIDNPNNIQSRKSTIQMLSNLKIDSEKAAGKTPYHLIRRLPELKILIKEDQKPRDPKLHFYNN